MAERKVLNKYFPPDFDPNKLPKGKAPKDNQWHVRMMLPFSCRCTNCGEFMGGGKKFNSRMETIKGAEYLGLRKYRFYQKCPVCSIDFTFYTDPEISDYRAEANIVRLSDYSSEKRNEEIEDQKKQGSAPEDPMQQLEDRTKDSKRQMEIMDNLDELMEIQQAKRKVNPEDAINKAGKRRDDQDSETRTQQQDVLTGEDEEQIRNMFQSKRQKVQRLNTNDDTAQKRGISIKPAKAAEFSSLSSSLPSAPAKSSVVIRRRVKRGHDDTTAGTSSSSSSSSSSSAQNDKQQQSTTAESTSARKDASDSDTEGGGGGLVGYASSSDDNEVEK